MNSPLSWVGGKSRLRKTIVKMMPDHTCYCEPFCGAAWVLFEKEPSKVEVINDINGELINFFRVIKKNYKAFLKECGWLLVSRELFEDFRRCNPKHLTPVERAVRFLYLVKCSFGGIPTFNSFGTFTTSKPKLNLRKLPEFISAVHERLKQVLIENLDFEQCISRYDRTHTFFYVDPPYWGVNYYGVSFGADDHMRLKEVLKKIKGKFLLSINDIPGTRALYKDFNVQRVEVFYSVSRRTDKRRKVAELLVRNY